VYYVSFDVAALQQVTICMVDPAMHEEFRGLSSDDIRLSPLSGADPAADCTAISCIKHSLDD